MGPLMGMAGLTDSQGLTQPKEEVSPPGGPSGVTDVLRDLSDAVDGASAEAHEQLLAGDLLAATDACRRLEELLQLLEDVMPGERELVWGGFADVVRPLTAAVFEATGTDGDGSGDGSGQEQAEAAELCWRITRILDAQLSHPIEIAPWVHELHNRLLIRGGQAWNRLSGDDTEAHHRAGWMFSRLAARLDPCPDWVAFFCSRLGVGPEHDPRPRPASSPAPAASLSTAAYRPPAASATAERPWDGAAISEDVIDWLHCHGVRGEQVELGVTYLPGGPVVSRDPGRLELNLAPLVWGDDWGRHLEDGLAAFVEPIRMAVQANALPRLGVRDSIRCLHGALGHLWRSGGELPLPTFHRLNLGMAVWNRLSGPGHLGARLLDGELPHLRLDAHQLIVQLDATELAALQSVLYQPDEAPASLARLRREHHNAAYWQQQSADWWCHPRDPEENMRRLHCESGFYAASGDALACLRRWADGSFACMAHAALWVNDPIAASFFLPVAQALWVETGVVPELHQRPKLEAFHALMAGRDVLYVGPHGEAVLDQHRSGRAFRLFADQLIEPYGLRVIEPPDSRYPQRPGRGFSASLEALIGQVEASFSRKPFGLLLANCGAYRLPLLEFMRERHGVQGAAFSLPLTALFGLDLEGSPRWRPDKRRPEAWRVVAATGSA